jgi:hypothetical protein
MAARRDLTGMVCIVLVASCSALTSYYSSCDSGGGGGEGDAPRGAARGGGRLLILQRSAPTTHGVTAASAGTPPPKRPLPPPPHPHPRHHAGKSRLELVDRAKLKAECAPPADDKVAAAVFQCLSEWKVGAPLAGSRSPGAAHVA